MSTSGTGSGPGFTPGDTAYTSDGRECQIVQELAQGAVVQMVFIEEDGARLSDPRFVSRVFKSPPIAKVADEYQRVSADLERAQIQLAETQRSLASEKARRDALLAKLKQIPALENLEAFVDGKVTHYVLLSWSGPSIVTLEETKSEYADRDCPYRLLSLFGKSRGDLGWKLNRYSDGSGSEWNYVYPCLSRDGAEAKMREILAAIASDGKYDGETCVLGLPELTKKAQMCGFVIPAEVVEKLTRVQNEALQQEVDKCRVAYEAALAKAGGAK